MKTRFFLVIASMLLATFLNVGFSQTKDVDNPNCWRWEKMKPADLEKAVKTYPVAYLVISPLEWHGDAMSFGTDPVIGTEIAELAWKKTGGVIIPTLYLGSETEYKDWTSTGLTSFWGLEWNTKEKNPGSLYVSNYVVELVLREMLSFIEREGFKACVLISGHGATEYSRILKEFEKRYADRPMKVFHSNLIEKVRPDNIDFKGSGGHADYAEASILGAVDSTQVDKSVFGKSARDQKVQLLDSNVGKIDYTKGRANINFRADRIAETVIQYMTLVNKTR